MHKKATDKKLKESKKPKESELKKMESASFLFKKQDIDNVPEAIKKASRNLNADLLGSSATPGAKRK